MSIVNKIKNKLKAIVVNHNYVRSSTKIGESTVMRGCNLSSDTTVGHHCKLRQVETSGNVSIGNYTSVYGPNVDLYAKINSIKIGNFCSIARNTSFQEYNHDFSRFSTYFIEQNLLRSDKHLEEITSKGDIVVEHDVWIGAHCVILSGAHISTGAVVAANSVVTGYIPPYAIVAGSPAKVIKYRFKEEVRKKLLETQWWNWEDEKIKEKSFYLSKLVSNQSN